MIELKPKLIIIAGPNGSGKTSVTHKILQHDWMEGCVYINPDNIARDVFGDWNSPEAVLNPPPLRCLTTAAATTANNHPRILITNTCRPTFVYS